MDEDVQCEHGKGSSLIIGENAWEYNLLRDTNRSLTEWGMDEV